VSDPTLISSDQVRAAYDALGLDPDRYTPDATEPQCARIASCNLRCKLDNGHDGDCWHCDVNSVPDPRERR
jgi:hypothetical protein